MARIKWLSIEIGHVATVPDSDYAHDSDQGAPDQRVILGAIRCSARAAWAAGGEFDVPDAMLKTDDWVAEKLEAALNFQLMPGRAPLRIRPEHVDVVSRCQAQVASLPPSSGWPGTRCRLRGDRWVNERSYCLYDASGSAWLSGELSPDHVAIITLSWECRTLGPCDLSGSALPLPPSP